MATVGSRRPRHLVWLAACIASVACGVSTPARAQQPGSAAALRDATLDRLPADYRDFVRTKCASAPSARRWLDCAHEHALQRFERREADLGQPPTLDELFDRATDLIDDLSHEARQVTEAMGGALSSSPARDRASIHYRQGRVYEALANEVRDVDFAMPAKMKSALARRGGPQWRRSTRRVLLENIRQVLKRKSDPILCLAIGRYAVAARTARDGGFTTPDSRSARRRLRQRSEHRLALCIAHVRKDEPELAPYDPGEFRARAAAGTP